MKKVLLVDSYVEKGDVAKVAQLRRLHAYQALMPDVELSFSVLARMCFTIVDNKLEAYDLMNKCSIGDYDAIVFCYWHFKPMHALALTTYLKRQGIPFLPAEEPNMFPPMDKLGELAKMSDGTVPLPNSLICQSGMMFKAFKARGSFIEFPCILKASGAGRGKKNHLVKDVDELKEVCALYPQEILILQEFIPNDSDYRVLVINKEPRFVMRRFRGDADTHLNNVSKGADAERVPNDSIAGEPLSAVLRAAELTHRIDFAGVDLMFDSTNGKHYILEVNKNPDMTTGANQALIDEKQALYVERIRSLL
jgi:glutathione synthase/RimK-type ligase-like ATP-grasp enzyme